MKFPQIVKYILSESQFYQESGPGTAKEKKEKSFGVYFDCIPKGFMLAGKPVSIKEFEDRIRQQKKEIKDLDHAITQAQIRLGSLPKEVKEPTEEQRAADLISRRIEYLKAQITCLEEERQKLLAKGWSKD